MTDHLTRTIWLAPDQLQVGRRCTLDHELQHVERGPLPADPVLAAREEAAVRQATARRMIDLDRLLDKVRWAHTTEELADELWVDHDTLMTRLRHLHPAEAAAVRRALVDMEEGI